MNDSNPNQKSKSYAESGVDTRAADQFVEGIKNLVQIDPEAKVKDSVGAYAAVYELTPDRWIALGCDGVGTKILWTLEELGTAEMLAQDLVAMNVNDLLCVGASPRLFLDYIGFTQGSLLEEGAILSQFLKGLQKACAKSHSLLVGGETAQMPDFYKEGHFDVSGFCVGDLAPSDWLHADLLKPGSKLWMWKSDGPHSNGFSWLRKIFDPVKDADFIKEHLMAPTKLYVEDFEKLKSFLASKNQSAALQAAFHITGSGLRNLLRMQPKGREIGFVIDQNLEWPVWMQEVETRTGASREEILCSLNGGWGFAVVLDEAFSAQHGQELQDLGLYERGYADETARVSIEGLEIR
ncbi:hypothetical protein GW916_00365 [bacterium]|nr:hypothetical protein [bacterium]